MNTSKVFIASLLSIAFVGCNKEDLDSEKAMSQPAPELTTEALDQIDFEYNSMATIKDKKNDNYVTYRVSSNDADAVKAMVYELEHSTLKDAGELKESQPSSKNNLQTNDAATVDYDFEKGVHLTEVERNIGTWNGYEVEMSDNLEKWTTVQSHNTITVTVDPCTAMEVQNLHLNSNNTHHFQNYTFDRVETLGVFQSYTFTAGGYTRHVAYVVPVNYNSGLTFNTKIRWRVW